MRVTELTQWTDAVKKVIEGEAKAAPIKECKPIRRENASFLPEVTRKTEGEEELIKRAALYTH